MIDYILEETVLKTIKKPDIEAGELHLSGGKIKQNGGSLGLTTHYSCRIITYAKHI